MVNLKTETFDKEHTHFGGIIYISDFNTDYRGKDNTNSSPIATRIEFDFKQEKAIKNAAKLNRRNNTYGKH